MPRYALVIGISEYQSDSLPNLSKPAGDAKAVADLLRKHGDFKTVTLLNQSKLREEDLWLAFETLLEKQGKGGEILIYFTGHGVVEETRRSHRGFLTSWDCSISEGRVTGGITFDDLNDLIAKSEISSLVMLLDCCHSGNLLGSAKESFTAFNKTDKDYLLITACRDFEQSAALKKEDHSLFTGAFLEALAEHRANDEAEINSGSLFGVISDCLKKRKQEPIYLGHGRAMKIVDYRQVVKSETQLQDVCPYVGLEAFDRETAKYFKGRDRFVTKLLQKLAESNFVPVIGASGSGKSSLVRAGLISALEKQGNWLILPPIKPGDLPLKPVGEISRVLAQLCQSADTKLEISNHIESGNLEAAIACLPEPQNILLVVDQFEEVFTVCPAEKEAERQQFIDLLVGITQYPDSRLRVVTTMRADFFEHCLGYRGLGEVIQDHQVVLLQMNEEELEEAIDAPAKDGEYKLDKGLLPKILQDIRGEGNVLPLLEFALTQLWEHRENRRLTLAAYDRLGGVIGALNKHADLIYAALKPQEQNLAKMICLRLVRTGKAEQGKADKDMSQRQSKGELLWLRGIEERETVMKVLAALVNGRLLTTGGEDNESAWVELAHESLMVKWDMFAQWLSENREPRRLHDQVRDAHRKWISNSRADDYLMTTWLLKEVSGNFLALNTMLSPDENSFYENSIAHQNKSLQELEQLSILKRNRIESLCQTSEVMRLSNMKLDALLEILKAVRQLEILRDNFRDSDRDEIQGKVNLGLQNTVDNVEELNRLEGHKQAVRNVCFSPNTGMLASISDDGTVKFWPMEEKHPDLSMQDNPSLRGMNFSHDGKVLAVGMKNGFIKLLSCNGDDLGSFEAHEGEQIRSLCFSPNTMILASGSTGFTVKLWDLQHIHNGIPTIEALKPSKTLGGHKALVNSLSFSRDGKILASGSADTTIRLWNVDDGFVENILKGHKDWVNSVSFSFDGQTLASGSRDRTVMLWDFKNSTLLNTIVSSAWITSVAFHPSLPILAFGGDDCTVRLFNQKNNRDLQSLSSHSAWISSLCFNSDGSVLASGSGDNSVRLWDFKRIMAFQHDGLVNCVSFSQDNKTIASGSSDHMVSLWGLDGQKIKALEGHKGEVWSVRYSPNDEILASGSDDKTIIFWDREGKRLNTLKGHEDGVRSVRFSPDGKKLASGSKDGTIILWDVEEKKILHKFKKFHEKGVRSVRFSKDGQLLASGSDDQTVKLWKVDEYELIHTFENLEATGIRSVRFTQDPNVLASGSYNGILKFWNVESYEEIEKPKKPQRAWISSLSFNSQKPVVASGSEDGVIRLWNYDNGAELAPLKGHKGWITSVSFSSDGQILASGSADGTIRLWYIYPDEILIRNLIRRGCDWVQNYLEANKEREEYKDLYNYCILKQS